MDNRIFSDSEARQAWLRKTAHLLRLEGDYVGAQEAERQLEPLDGALPLPDTKRQQKSAA